MTPSSVAILFQLCSIVSKCAGSRYSRYKMEDQTWFTKSHYKCKFLKSVSQQDRNELDMLNFCDLFQRDVEIQLAQWLILAHYY